MKIWNISSESGEWSEAGKVVHGNQAGEVWAIALSEDGQFLASTTYDGRINVWDLNVVAEQGTKGKRIREYETKGSFGMCVDMSRDGRFTATGHENGAVYVFNNDTGRMLYSLPGKIILQNGSEMLMKLRPCQAHPNSLLLTGWYTSRSRW